MKYEKNLKENKIKIPNSTKAFNIQLLLISPEKVKGRVRNRKVSH